MEPALNQEREVEGDPNVPQCLATLGDHFNTVNCVRFLKMEFPRPDPPTRTCFLQKRAGQPHRVRFLGRPNVENWVNCQHLRGHLSDVIDIAWAPTTACSPAVPWIIS